MKAIVATLLLVAATFTASAFAQDSPASKVVAPGCGPADAKFSVKADKGQHPAAEPGPGKAIVYFVEDDTHFQSTPKPTTRIGLDGAWIGANHGNSYFSFSVDPGEHHLCASWQSFIGPGSRNKSAAAHFTAEAGSVYYFRVENTWLREVMIPGIELAPLDSDEGQLLASKFAFSTFQPKN
jgi:hypothetical protein